MFDLSTPANIAQIISVIVPAVSAIVVWRHKNCHIPRCHKIGRFEVDGTTAWVCDKHHTEEHHDWLRRQHPEDRLTH